MTDMFRDQEVKSRKVKAAEMRRAFRGKKGNGCPRCGGSRRIPNPETGGEKPCPNHK